MTHPYAVRATRNFERNLTVIADFFGPERRAAFEKLCSVLTEKVVPLLEMQPGVGRLFFSRTFSMRTDLLLKTVRLRVGSREVREYVVGSFVLLYLVADRSVYLLALKDRRQHGYFISGE